MGPRLAFTLACFTGTLVVTSAVASCGARTGLLDESDETFDAGSDGIVLPDEFQPAPPPDAFSEDDNLRAIDVGAPDAPVFDPCPDAAATLIYVIGQTTRTLYSYDPPTATFTTIGVISCPGAGASMPFSMAVDREGIAYVEFADGPNDTIGANLYRVSTKTASCTPTTYDPAANGRVTYGMGFVGKAGDGGDAGETLFIAQQSGGENAQNALATIDTTTFTVSAIGPFSSEVHEAELTGTGDGRLFAFYNQNPGGSGTQSSSIGQIDTATGQVVAADTLALAQGGGWAFAFWGGDFYMFTAPNDFTVVTRFNPVDHTLVQEASLPGDVIVGAGVSTCAPVQ